MAISTADLWKLLADSRLLNAQQCDRLAADFGNSAAAEQPGPKPLAQWLVSQNVISRYQATVLLTGRPGPFWYGDYKIYDRIHRRPLAGSFRAVHRATHHPVVLSFLSGTTIHDSERWNRLDRLTQLNHPQLIRYYETVDLGSYRFVVLEQLQGISLDEQLKSKGPLAAAEACRLVRLTAEGLARLHATGRSHGELRSRDVWLEPGGSAKLLVYTELASKSPELLHEVLHAGKQGDDELLRRADYLAPELIQAGQAPDELTDIYALGCCLYEAIAGHPPFAGGTVKEKMERHAGAPVARLDWSACSPAIAQVVALMLAKKRERRLQSATAVAQKLAPVAAQAAVKPARPLPSQAAYEAWLKDKRAAATAAVPPVAAGQEETPARKEPSRIQTEQGGAGQTNAGRGASTKGRGSVAERIRREQARRRKTVLMAAGGVAVASLLIGIAFLALNNLGSPGDPANRPGSQLPNANSAAITSNAPSEKEASSENEAGENQAGEEVSDSSIASDKTPAANNDEQALWASPTDGEPISLENLPGGAEVFLIARPSKIQAGDEGKRVLTALGPDFERARKRWEAASGFALGDIEQLVVGLYSNSGQFPRISSVARLAEAAQPQELLERWGSPEERTAGDGTYYVGSQWSYYIPPAMDDRSFVMGHQQQIEELAETGGGPLLLRREFGKLLRVSDDQRHVTILFAPNFLFGDGRPLFSGQRSKVLGPLEDVLGDGVKAGMLELHFGKPFYCEMRIEGDVVSDRSTLASRFRQQLAEVPESVETYLTRLNPHPYWRRVAFRYPSMVRVLCRQARIGVEGDHAIINAALPEAAAHNLVFGTEVLLASAPSERVVSDLDQTAETPQTIEEVLNSRISVSFDQDSLEFSMQNVEKEVESEFKSLPFDFEIHILGEDLELEGITRNQQIRDFRSVDRTVADVLTDLVMQANPVTTVKAPSETDQKLVWVIGSHPDNPSNRTILITTRQVAQQKYTLPEPFRSK